MHSIGILSSGNGNNQKISANTTYIAHIFIFFFFCSRGYICNYDNFNIIILFLKLSEKHSKNHAKYFVIFKSCHSVNNFLSKKVFVADVFIVHIIMI